MDQPGQNPFEPMSVTMTSFNFVEPIVPKQGNK